MILDGKAVAQRVTDEVRAGVAAFVAAGHPAPGLAVVLVGENAASQVYVRNKRKTTETVGMRSFAHDLPADTSEDALLALIDRLNDDPAVNGILVQLPLPEAHRCGEGHRAHRSEKGRRRLPSVQHRPPRAQDARAAAVHALWLHAPPEGDRRRSRRHARRGDRAIEHRRPPDGARAPDGAMHGHDLSLGNARPARNGAQAPTSSSRASARRSSFSATGSSPARS